MPRFIRFDVNNFGIQYLTKIQMFLCAECTWAVTLTLFQTKCRGKQAVRNYVYKSDRKTYPTVTVVRGV